MEYLRVKNWETFQHYKDRSPPWIKLHRDLLRDYQFSCLQDASKLQLMLIWLLASQLDNKIPNDPAWIQRQLGLSEAIKLKPLIDMGFLVVSQDASKPLAGCKQSAIVETETEAYKEEAEKDKGRDDSFWKTEDLESEFKAFKKMRTSIKAPLNEVAEARLIAKLEKMKAEGVDIREAINRSIENCWKGVFAPGGDNGQGKRQSNGTGVRYGETPADRNLAATERYLRERGHAAVAEND